MPQQLEIEEEAGVRRHSVEDDDSSGQALAHDCAEQASICRGEKALPVFEVPQDWNNQCDRWVNHNSQSRPIVASYEKRVH